MKRIIYLFLLSLISFFVFTYIDEYQVLIAPLLKDNKSKSDESVNLEQIESQIDKFLIKFNNELSEAYLSGEPSEVGTLPVAESLKRAIAEEIIFHRKRGMKMELTFESLSTINVKKLSPVAISVDAVERLRIRYLGLRDKNYESQYSEKNYGVKYSLITKPEWTIVSFEVVPKSKVIKKKK